MFSFENRSFLIDCFIFVALSINNSCKAKMLFDIETFSETKAFLTDNLIVYIEAEEHKLNYVRRY